jgi:integrase
VRRVKRAKETLGEPRAWPVPVLDRIIAGVGPDRARAQLHLLLWTGMPPGSLARLPMGDVDLEAWTIRYPARRKGAGAQPVLLPIVPAGRARVRAWLRAFAWGGVDGVNLTRRLRVATARYRMAHPDCPVPADVQLYDLRDSFLTWLYAETGDPLLVQLYGQHADLATTYRYIRGGVPARAAAAIAAMAATEVLPRFAATVLTTAGDETGRRLTNGPSGGRGGFPRKA